MTDYLINIPIEDIYPNPHQPRLEFDQFELNELAESIKLNGIIQPIIVRKSSIVGYELIAGERRLRASKLAKLLTIPAIVKTISTEDSMKQAIIENLQRSNLNPIEEAKAYKKLLKNHDMTHEELAKLMGKSRPYISNCLRLLQLPNSLEKAVKNGNLSQGHARVLLTLKTEEEQLIWFEKINAKNLSVRELEKKLQHKTKKRNQKKDNLFLNDLEKKLSQLLGSTISLEQKKDLSLKLTCQFKTEEDLNNLINKLK